MLNTKQKCWKNQAIPSASFFVQKDNGGVCICFDPFFFVNYASLVVLQDKVYFFMRFGLPQGGKIMFLKVVPYRQARDHTYYWYLVESYRQEGKVKHRILKNFGLVSERQVAYLKVSIARDRFPKKTSDKK